MLLRNIAGLSFLLLACFIIHVYSGSLPHLGNIPNQIIFDEKKIKDFTEFKYRLHKLQDTANLYLTPELMYTSFQEDMDSLHKTLFLEFVDLFQRDYSDIDEEHKKRFSVFQESLARHAVLNSNERKKNGTARYGINKFSDWTREEFLGLLKPQTNKMQNIYDMETAQPCSVYMKLNDAADWRKHITGIKDQKNCGSCWAFVASEQVETYASINGYPLVELSPQELISCSPSLGCEGGNTCAALTWLKQTQNMLIPEKQYPYEAKEGLCQYDSLNHTGGVRIKNVCGCKRLADEEEYLLYILSQKGPLGVNVDAVLWRDYIGGIIQHHCTNLKLNHAVQIVGYSLKDGPVPYYRVRNQWGSSYGEDGFLRIKYGENICGVAEEPSFISFL